MHSGVVYALLHRLTPPQITKDQAALRQIMRLRGYSVMKLVLDEYGEDLAMCELVRYPSFLQSS